MALGQKDGCLCGFQDDVFHYVDLRKYLEKLDTQPG